MGYKDAEYHKENCFGATSKGVPIWQYYGLDWRLRRANSRGAEKSPCSTFFCKGNDLPSTGLLRGWGQNMRICGQ